MPKEVWSPYRRWMSNLVPLLFCAPFFTCGLLLYQRGDLVPAFACWAAFPIVGWLAVNAFGLFQNAHMIKELRPKLRAEYPGREDSAVFVGFARPRHLSLLDAHEDVGWLLVLPDRVEFLGEKQRHFVKREEIVGVRFRPNAHTLLGLGRWVSVEARRDGKPLRLLIEPRQRGSFLANRKLGGELLRMIKEWIRR